MADSPAAWPPAGGASTVTLAAGSAVAGKVGLQVGGVDLANGNPLPISDGGGAITVDGTVTISDGSGPVTVDGAAAPLVGGTVVSNGNPLPVSDGGGSLTVDAGASEAHIGEVGGKGILLQQSLGTTTNGAYAINDVIGAKTSVSAARVSNGSGVLLNVGLAIKSPQTGIVIDLYVFNADPSGATITDNGALVLTAADQAKLVDVITCDDCRSIAASSFLRSAQKPSRFKCTGAGVLLWLVAVAKTAITLASTTDVVAVLGVDQD